MMLIPWGYTKKRTEEKKISCDFYDLAYTTKPPVCFQELYERNGGPIGLKYASDHERFLLETDWTDESCIALLTYTTFAKTVGKKKLALQCVKSGRTKVLEWVLENGYLRTWNAVEEALKEAQTQKNAAAAAMLIEYRRQKGIKAPKQRSMNPLAAENLRREWGTKILEDGSLELTYYKGKPEPGTIISIPDHIGTKTVTQLRRDLFRSVGYVARCNICEVYVPGTIRSIPRGLAIGMDGLERVVLEKGVQVACTFAFEDCLVLKEIVVPDDIEMEKEAVVGCPDAQFVYAAAAKGA